MFVGEKPVRDAVLVMFQLSDSTRSPSEEKLDQVYFTVFYLENVEFDLKSG